MSTASAFRDDNGYISGRKVIFWVAAGAFCVLVAVSNQTTPVDTGATVLMLLFLILYFLPTINAAARHHRNTSAIFALNLLLGWTALGWIIAFIWSWTSDRTAENA